MTRIEMMELDRTSSDTFAAHRAYYAQYVTEGVRLDVASYFGLPLLRESYASDKHLNRIPLRAWYRLGFPPVSGVKLRDNGDFMSQATAVAIWKEAARQFVDNNA